MDDRFGEWKGGQDLLERLPGHAALLASFAERLSPEPDDAVFEGAECPVVEDDPVVLTVSQGDRISNLSEDFGKICVLPSGPLDLDAQGAL